MQNDTFLTKYDRGEKPPSKLSALKHVIISLGSIGLIVM